MLQNLCARFCSDLDSMELDSKAKALNLAFLNEAGLEAGIATKGEGSQSPPSLKRQKIL